MGLLDGKVAVITGGSRGLGLAIAHAYAREGARLVLASRSERAVAEAVSGLKSAGAAVSGFSCDVGDLSAVERLGDHALAIYGQIDIWVNNAGLSAPYGPTMGVRPEAFAAAIQTNVFGTYHGSLVALRHLLPRRSGKLINLLGRGEREPVPLQNAYAASKAWVRNFTRALAAEHKGSGVSIIGFNPGLVLTDLVQQVEAVEGYEEQVKVLPTILRMFGNPPDMPAERAVWLASAATDGRTGLESRILTPGRMLSGALREGLRRLTGRQAPELPFTVRTVPAEQKMGD